MSKESKFRTGTILALSAAFLWAVNIIITKYILRAGENPVNIMFWITIISLPFWIGRFITKKEEAKKASKKDYLILISIGIIATLLATMVEFYALKYSQAINYSFLIRSVMIFTVGFAAIFLKEKITFKKIILVVLILTGAYLVATGGKVISLSIGDGLTLFNAALIAFGNTILGKIAAKTMSPGLSASGSFLFGLLPVVAVTFMTKSFAIPHTLWLLLLLSFFGILSATVRFKAYKYCTASFLSMIYSTTPVFVALMAFILLGETITIIQLIGGLLVISGGIYAERTKI